MEKVQVQALRGINLDVKKGEFLAIMGASGSGKSTMLNAVGCLDIPTKGNIFLDNQNIAHLSESNLAQIRGRKIGFVFQRFNLISSLTAIENVMLPMTFQNISRERRLRRAELLLGKVGLSHRINHFPGQLSGGELQRVAIARALVNDPEVILADEPTGNLDSKSGQEIITLLKDLHKKEHRTIILVTHDHNIARQSERIAHLKDGQIIDFTIDGQLPKVPA